MIYPTTYISPEECMLGDGLRCLCDSRFFHVPEPESLCELLLSEIEEALAKRIVNFAVRDTPLAQGGVSLFL